VTLADTVALTPDPEVVELAGQKPARLLRQALRLWRTRIGLVLAGGVVLIALIGPYIAPHGPADFVGAPNSTHPGIFGTDHLGQDVWSRFLNGGRSILWIATAATVIGITSGALVGLVAAYSRNSLDDVLMRAMDVILAFPQIMLALVALVTLGAKSWLIILAVGLTTTPRVARVVRGAAQPIVERDFVAAADALGVPRWRVLFAEVLPNVMSPLMVETGLRLTYAIVLVASLAFLGFTPNPNGADWGLMIFENRIALSVQPWGVMLPVIAIGLLTLGTGLIGDGIARAAAGIDRRRGGE
jgi:peptide/nickel transport system permease protein